ncbi:unnamed protein product [Closterium sp. NIES-54]
MNYTKSSLTPLPPLSLLVNPAPVAPLPPPGPAPSVPPGFPPRPSSPPLQPVAVDSGAAGGGDTGGADFGGAGSGGAECPTGTGAACGAAVGGAGGAGAGGAGARQQEPLSPEWLRKWAVRWGSPGGGVGCTGVDRAGGTGAGGTGAVGDVAGGPAGAAGTGSTRPGGASASVLGVGGTGGADPRGADIGRATGGTGVGGTRRQESLSPQHLREWAVRWGSPGGGAGSTGSGGAVATGAGGFGGATTQPQQSALSHLLGLLPAVTEFPIAGTTPLILFPPPGESQPQLLPHSPLPAPAPHIAVTESLTGRTEPASHPVMPVRTCGAVRPCPPPVPGKHLMALRLHQQTQGYSFSVGTGSVSWRSTCSSSVLSSSCDVEIYAGAMAAQELRCLTYLLTDLGERPCSPRVLYVDNKAMIVLCQDQRLENRTKRISLRYLLTRELQQHVQLCLAYVATHASTADVFTKALLSSDHQRFCTALGLVPSLPHLLVS